MTKLVTITHEISDLILAKIRPQSGFEPLPHLILEELIEEYNLDVSQVERQEILNTVTEVCIKEYL